MCKKIHRGGNAEQYYADKKYKEAVAVAVEKCAADTKGQKCYICLEAVHSRTGEGLVRGCACGDRDGVSSPELGVAHVSCLARQAKELVAEAEENDWDDDKTMARWDRWDTCSLCEEQYHGVVRCALGWGCWKTYVGRPETDWTRCFAIQQLGNGLSSAEHHEDALSIRETELAMKQRLGAEEEELLIVQGNLANTYAKLDKPQHALRIRREVYTMALKLYGEEREETITQALNYTSDLFDVGSFKEAKALLLRTLPVARRVLGNCHEITLQMRQNYAAVLYNDPGATLDDLREAVTTLEDLARIARRVLGSDHPTVSTIKDDLRQARAMLYLQELREAQV